MPHFRVEMIDGSERAVEAQRMTHGRDRVVFEYRAPEAWTSWTTVLELSADQVAEVRRRVTENNGTHRWIRARSRRAPQ